MAPLNAKTIGTILGAAALAYGELHQSKVENRARIEISSGVVEYVNGMLDPRDQEIADLKARLRVLEERR